MALTEWLVIRRVFPSWTIELPAGFSEEFRAQDGTWHARDATRRISMTSVTVTSAATGAPATAQELLAQVPLEGRPVSEAPDGVSGRAVRYDDDVDGLGRVEVLRGAAAVSGRLLVVTISGGTPAWALATWQSIRHVPAAGGAAPAAATRGGRGRW